MPLTLIAGPPGSGKTTLLLDALKESLRRRSGLFIVPTEVTAGWLRRHLLGSLDTGPASTTALIGEAFISWSQFVRRLADARRPTLSRMELTLFIYKLLASHPLRYFRTRRPTLGIAGQFAETILALKKNGIGPPRLRQILRTRGSLKENDLLTIFERYEEARRGLRILDDGDLVAMATKNLRNGRAPFLQGIETILIDEFHHISPGQLETIQAIKKGWPRADIRISFPQATSEESLYAAYLERGLEGIGALADRMVHCKAQEIKSPEVCVKSTRSPRQEVLATVSAIKEEMAQSNGDGHDVVLVSRPTTSFLQEFLAESEASGLLLAHPHEAAPMGAPILHRLLAPAGIENWPAEAPIQEYVKRCMEFVRDGNKIAHWNEEAWSSPR
jgi:ATP-dependent helicase/DNAse subunit B